MKKFLSIAGFILGFIPLLTSAQGLEPAHRCWGPSARQAVMGVNIDKGNSPRVKNYLFKAHGGYKICYATTNEMSALPKGQYYGGATKYRFHNKTPNSSEFSIELPCSGGAIDPGWVAGIIGAYACGPSCAAKAAAGATLLADKSGNSCGVGGKTNWFDGNAVFVVFPESESCPPDACQTDHPVPWEKF